MTSFIRLADGTLIEVEAQAGQRQINTAQANRVNNQMEIIKPVVTRAATALVESLRELSSEVRLEQAELEFGLSFEAEGNVFITKAKTGANLTIKLTLKQNT